MVAKALGVGFQVDQLRNLAFILSPPAGSFFQADLVPLG